MPSRSIIGVLVAGALLAACAGERPRVADSADAATASAPATVPATVPAPAIPARMDPTIDSLLRAFRAGLPEATELASGATTRDSLAAAFVRAVAARDTTALRSLHLTRAEFAWLYFPSARIAMPPYGIAAGLLWLQLTGTGAQDLGRAMAVVGPDARFVAVACPEPPRAEGTNRIHERCLTVLELLPGRSDTLSLFGSIVERDGRFKLLSFVNRL